MNFKANYFVIPLFTILVAVLGSLLTTLGMPWYDGEIVKPLLTPPKWVFPIVWNLIFILATVSAIIVWNRGMERERLIGLIPLKKMHQRYWVVIYVFIANALLNILWSYLFFFKHQIRFALVEMFFLELTNFILLFTTWKISKTASLLLVLYTLWVGFATYLTYQVLVLNT